MPLGRTPITWNMTVRDALLNVINEDMEELFSRVEALELGLVSGVGVATEEEAIAGVDNTKAMTPLRTHQAIAANPGGYLRPADHTKALHDALGIDADTLDGHHAFEFAMPADHTKALHDALGIDADTLDGYDSTGFHKKDENIQLSEGQIIDFADESGDKLRLHGTQYGVAVNTNELTLYAPSGSEIAVRDGAYNGQKLGDLIHTGNSASKGLSSPLGRYVSTPGDYCVRSFLGNLNVYNNPKVVSFYIPWTGTTRYTLRIDGSSCNITIKINSITYGPYAHNGTPTDFSIDSDETGYITIRVDSDIESGPYLKSIHVKTGNAYLVHKLPVLFTSSYSVIDYYYPL